MNKIFSYITAGLEIASVVEAMIQLIAAKQPVTAAILSTVISPGIQALQLISPKITLPPALINDIIQAAADAINKYVIKTPGA